MKTLEKKFKNMLHGSIEHYIDISFKNINTSNAKMIIMEDFEDIIEFNNKNIEDLKKYLQNSKNYFDAINNENPFLRFLSVLDKQTGKRFLSEYKEDDNDIVLIALEIRNKYK